METPKQVKATYTAYRTNLGLFVRRSSKSYGSYAVYFDSLVINGKHGSEYPMINDYVFLEGVHDTPKIERKVPQAKVHVGYKLKYEKLETEEIPKTILLNEVTTEWNDDDKLIFVGKYQDLQDLYEPYYEIQEPKLEDAEVNLNIVRDIIVEDWNRPEKMTIRMVHDKGWNGTEVKDVDLNTLVSYDELEKMLTPEFLLHTRPCSIDSDTTYKIVRQYVKDNYDRTKAAITSDYDFCFTVKKRIKAKPWEEHVEQLTPKGNSYKPPRYKYKKVEEKLVEVFEMTPASKKYNNYTVMEGFKGENLQDLIDNVKAFLDNLMSVINASVHECQACGGCGHIVETAKGIKR